MTTRLLSTRKRRWRPGRIARVILITGIGLGTYFLLPLPGLSEPSLPDRIDRKRDQIERDKQREGVLTETIAGYASRIRSIQGDIRGYVARERTLQTSLDSKRAEVRRVQDRLERARARLAKLKLRLDETTDALAVRLVELYKADEPDILTVVLESEGFADLLDRTTFLERVAEQDRRIVSRVRELRREAARVTRDLVVLERSKQRAADAIVAHKDQVRAARVQLVERQTALADARSARRATLSKIRFHRDELEEELAALEKEQARVQARIRAAQRAASARAARAPRGSEATPQPAAPIRRGSGALIWPVNGPITSPFGQRWGRLHAGIDIAVPNGTPVRAAEAGRVVIAAPTGAYGNYVCVAHAGSLSTCYAHNSSLSVSPGQTVKQGQVVALSGNTGRSSGPHVHFETRVSGTPVNPMNYL